MYVYVLVCVCVCVCSVLCILWWNVNVVHGLSLCGVSVNNNIIEKADAMYLIATTTERDRPFKFNFLKRFIIFLHEDCYKLVHFLHAFCILKGFPHFRRPVPHTTFQVWNQIYR